MVIGRREKGKRLYLLYVVRRAIVVCAVRGGNIGKACIIAPQPNTY